MKHKQSKHRLLTIFLISLLIITSVLLPGHAETENQAAAKQNEAAAAQAEEKTEKEISAENEAVISQATMLMDSEQYDDHTILVIMKAEASDMHAEYEPEDFTGIAATEVQNLTYIPESAETALASDDYQNILSVTLKEGGSEKILETIEALLEREDVESAYPNIEMSIDVSAAFDDADEPNDPGYASQWALEKINAPGAWAIETGSREVTVALIDTGVDFTHEDLADNIWTNPGETEDGTDSDGNGYVDDIRGWNFYNDNNDVQDAGLHGTTVAGVIGAVTNNGVGISGVCPEVSLVPLRTGYVNSEGESILREDLVIEAITYCISNNIDIINFSAGYSIEYAPIDTVISNYNGLFVAAAGNSSLNLDTTPFYPLTSAHSNVIKVASTGSGDTISSFTNYGATEVDLAAPGSSIRTTAPGNAYANSNGTSYSAPHVAGVAALIKAYCPELTPEQIIDAIVNSTDKVGELNGKVISGGRLNAKNALIYASGITGEVTVSFDELNTLIQTAEQKKNEGYTSRTWRDLQTALSAAKKLTEQTYVTQDEIDQSCAVVSAALKGLILKTDPDAYGTAGLLEESTGPKTIYYDNDTGEQIEKPVNNQDNQTQQGEDDNSGSSGQSSDDSTARAASTGTGAANTSSGSNTNNSNRNSSSGTNSSSGSNSSSNNSTSGSNSSGNSSRTTDSDTTNTENQNETDETETADESENTEAEETDTDDTTALASNDDADTMATGGNQTIYPYERSSAGSGTALKVAIVIVVLGIAGVIGYIWKRNQQNEYLDGWGR